MKLKFLLSLFLMLATSLSQAVENPTFTDGKDYYSYHQARSLDPIPKGKVVIQYFFEYGCTICLVGDDNLRRYASLHPDKVELRRTPAANNAFTANMYAALSELGREDLAERYLFDSATGKEKQDLTQNDEAIKRWLTRHQIDIPSFFTLYQSQAVKKRMENAAALFNHYQPPLIPIAVLNGKYIVAKNTLYDEDYTAAVLDFLIQKLQQKQELQ